MNDNMFWNHRAAIMSRMNFVPVTPENSRVAETDKHFVTEPFTRSGGPRPLVLVVDADRESRADLECKLKVYDYRVVGVESASTAIELMEQQRFDVCLLDMNFIEMDAIEMIHRIRLSPTTGKPAIIVVADAETKFAAADAIENGADDYLEKPADERLLHARIRSSLRQIDARLAELSKFLPRNILNQVLSNANLLEKPSPADVSVMVCDVRGFSRTSERVGPVQTITWISDVMNELSRIVLDHGGTIVDYVGDEIMAMWGAPIASPQHAGDACRCAVAIQQAVNGLSEKWRSTVGGETRMGIGINSGLAVVGNTGSTHRIKYGPLGDTVNMASRVQGATKYLRSSILMTQSTAGRVDASLRGRRVCSVRVHNIREPVQLYELGRCGSDDLTAGCAAYEHALSAFESAKHAEAQDILAQLLLEHPQDGPAKLLMLRVIQSQLGGEFDPVWTLPGA
ncbi:response regulator [Novipirellula sp. SH528]|uniref:adenylate/guanylate cyclase domain-containing protein n=1 Tax=Novipirellula sp. SH528 TaxID=3454466 RepID=UPI003F9F654B